MIRDLVRALLALSLIALAASICLRPPVDAPLLIDAAARNCPQSRPTPLPHGMGPRRVPLSDSRRIA